MASWFELFRLVLKRELLARYPRFFLFFTHAGVILLNLAIYWFTARAFVPKLEIEHLVRHDYFHFIVAGEVALLLPLAMTGAFALGTRRAATEGVLEEWFLLPRGPRRAIVVTALAITALALLELFVTMVLAMVVFDFSLSLKGIVTALALILLALPAFAGLGLAGAGALLAFGRGDHLILSAGGFIAVISGAYFPLAVLPGNVGDWLLWLSPFSLVVAGTRDAFFGEPLRQGAFGALLAWDIVLMICGILTVRYGERAYRRRGGVAAWLMV